MRVLVLVAVLLTAAVGAAAQGPDSAKTPAKTIAKTRGRTVANSPATAAAKSTVVPQGAVDANAAAKTTLMVNKPPGTLMQLRSSRAILIDATAARSRGDYDTALVHFNAVLRGPADSLDRSERTRALLGKAQTCEAIAWSDKSRAFWLDSAKATYARVIETGDAGSRTLALNNLGVMYVRQGNPAAAVEALKRVPSSSLPQSQAPLYRYNLARAYEATGDTLGALGEYRAAALGAPRFGDAVEGTYRTLLQVSPPPIRDAIAVTNALVDSGRAGVAAAQGMRCLSKWGDDAAAQDLLAAVLRAYARDGVTLDGLPQVNELGTQFPDLGPIVREVSFAFHARFKPVFAPGVLMEYFPHWSGRRERQQAFAELLVAIGDAYARGVAREQGRQAPDSLAALARYTAAFELDPRNTDAALKVIGQFHSHPNELDPHGDLIERMTDILFESKGVQYHEHQWLNIIRMHLVLASIFEQQGRWGPPGDSHTAVFQLEHAVQVDRIAHEEGFSPPPSPGVNERLAVAYLHLKRPRDAWGSFLNAAAGFVALNDRESAEAAVKGADTLKVALAPSDLKLRDAINAKIGKLPED
jgi:tetratricopeptide (TPR) repeat protein